MARTGNLRILGTTLLAAGLAMACSKPERDFSELFASGGGPDSGGEDQGGATSGTQDAGAAGAAGADAMASAGAGGAPAAGSSGSPAAGVGGAEGSAGTAGTQDGGGNAGAAGATSGGTAGATSGGNAGAAGATSGGTAGATSGGTAGTTSGGTAGTTSGGAAGATCQPTSSSETDCEDELDDDCDGWTDCDDLADCAANLACCVPSSTSESLCDNAKDDDCDGFRDCDDSDCASSVSCQVCVPTSTGAETNCEDGVDDDCDDRTDCEDLDCASEPACLPDCVPDNPPAGDSGPPEEISCTDTVDNDCNGFLDCEDPACASDPSCQAGCTVSGAEVCSDGTTDEDCDGFAGCQDAECAATPGCCSSSSGAVELCGNGVDDDCDGTIDCPVIVGTFPLRPALGRANWEGGAAAGTDVVIQLDAPARTEYSVQCRSGKPSMVATENFVACNPEDPQALDVHPHNAAWANDPNHDGLTTTELRLAYPNGATSTLASFTYYVHHSLVGAGLCEAKASDADYFDAARDALVAGGTPRFNNSDAWLANPFINVAFDPPLSGEFEIVAGDGPKEMLSLRRRFTLDAGHDMLLMHRVYESRRATSRYCLAAMIRKHLSEHGNRNYNYNNGCDAVVLNKQGAGVCLVVREGGVIALAYETSSYWERHISTEFEWDVADNFMWRKLARPHFRREGTHQLFSPKCYEGGADCTGGDPYTLYLPDRGLFPGLP